MKISITQTTTVLRFFYNKIIIKEDRPKTHLHVKKYHRVHHTLHVDMNLPALTAAHHFQIKKFVSRIMQLTVANCIASVDLIVHHKIA